MTSFVKYGSFTLSGSKQQNSPNLGGYPTPQLSIALENDRDGAGKVLGGKYIINLEGQLYSASGSGGFSQLAGYESGLRAAFGVSGDGGLFSFGCGGTTLFSGYAKVSRYLADKSPNYWTSTINYSIDLEVEITGSNLYNVSSVQDEWSIEPLDELSYVPNPYPAAGGAGGGSQNQENIPANPFNFPTGPMYPTYRISRTVGAVGKFIPTGSGGSGISAITSAKNWVKNQLSSGVTLTGIVSGLVLYNFVRSISANATDGSYRITDTFLGLPTGASGGYTESFTVESALDNTYLRTITINGTIKGLEPINSGGVYSTGTIGDNISGSLYPTVPSGRSVGTTTGGGGGGVGTGPASGKFANAMSGYTGIKGFIYDRCRAFMTSGSQSQGGSSNVNTGTIFGRFFGRPEAPLNPLPVTITEGFNPAEGTVSYSWTYNNRPLNLVSGSINETLTVNDNFPAQQIAEIFVLGRRLGPILQDLGTYTSASRDVTFEVTFLRPTGLSGLKFPKTAYTAITGVVESFNPTYLLGPNVNDSVCKAFVKSNTENWNISEGRFVKQKSWAWVKCDNIVGSNPNVGQ